MNNLGYKVKYLVKYYNYKNFLEYIFSVFGILVIIDKVINLMFNVEAFHIFLSEYNIFISIGIVLWALYHKRPLLSKTFYLENSDVKLTLKVGNILEENGAIVIPTNTTFDTLMEDEFISKNSVQGQFQNKYFLNNLKSLDLLLIAGIENTCIPKTLERRNSKTNQYDIGTVSKINVKDQHIYFLATSDINENGKPINGSFSTLQCALESFWNEVNERGNLENIAFPIIGSGKGGLKASREDIVKEIVFSFIVACRNFKLSENLLIYIHPSDLTNNRFDLEYMYEYFDYMCKFGQGHVNTDTEGTGLS